MTDDTNKIEEQKEEQKIEEVTEQAAEAQSAEAQEAQPVAAPEEAKKPASPSEEEEDENDAIGNLKNPPPSATRRQGRGPSLGEADPYWQFGTPVESWGSTQGRKGGTVAGTGLADNDPYWTFGVPPSYWGKSQENAGPQQGHGRPRVYFECQRCGVKVERKAIHRGGAVCPFCNRPMRQVGGQDQHPRDRRHPRPQEQKPEQAPAEPPAQAETPAAAPVAPEDNQTKE